MADNIDRLVTEVIEREGGYADHPADKGGPTRWGVTQAVARASDGYAGDMRVYPRERAAALYRRLYWSVPGFDLVAQRAPAIAAELFDTGINMGVAVAGGFLQRALNALNREARDYPDLTPDGRIGPATLTALDAYLRVRGKAGEAVLLKAMEALQGERYVSLAERRPGNEAFLYGWLSNRVGTLLVLFAILLTPLAGCATTGNSHSKARTAVERADDAFARIRTRADAVLPKLPPATAQHVSTALAVADMALALARATTDPAERENALRRAAVAAADVTAALIPQR